MHTIFNLAWQVVVFVVVAKPPLSPNLITRQINHILLQPVEMINDLRKLCSK